MQVVNKGYGDTGASFKKKALKGFIANSGHPKDDIDAHNATLRQRSRMLFMGAPIATAALKRQRTNVVGSGLQLKSTIDRDVLGMSQEDAEAWQRQVEAEFAIWAENKTLAMQSVSMTSMDYNNSSCWRGQCQAMYLH